LSPQPVPAQDAALPPPSAIQTGEETPWIYRGSDVPRDEEWLFGEMANGLRYAVRRNGVPPDQISIRVRIDAGSLHEEDSERGYAHLLEHLLFRESKYLQVGEAIATWQRLGATFGSDTNASTTPTQTVYKLDLPNIDDAKLEESFRLLSGMIREPVLSKANVVAEVPIVLAEKRERGGAAERSGEISRRTLYAGQRLAIRNVIGTDETLAGATARSVQAFHRRWYRPENTVIVAVGDADPMQLAALVEKHFGDWEGPGTLTPAPDFGDPVAPAGADPANPVGETAVIVEPDLPRVLSYGVMRPWRPVQDTIVYNQGLLRDSLALALINRRLEAKARAGGSYLYAQVQQEDVSRSADATFVSLAPLTEDWQSALVDVRGVIADALASPPTEEEIDREIAEFEQVFVSSVAERSVLAGSKLAEDIVQAVDIRETVAAPDTVLMVFRGMKDAITPAQILKHTRALFSGSVVRAAYVTPATGEADAASLRSALQTTATPDGSARLTASSISFDDIPPIGPPGEIESVRPIGALEVEQVDLANGVKALIWPNSREPGRVFVKVRFGGGYRSFADDQGAYARLGEMALIGSGLGDLGQEELDRISTGRKMGFDFQIGDGAFTFSANSRPEDLEDQLYLFAAKLAMPRWDAAPFERAKAAARIAYTSYSSSPSGVLNRDLEALIRADDPRYATPDLEDLAQASPAGFRETWAPILRQGPVEVLIFGDFDRSEGLEALKRTFGALALREPLPQTVADRIPHFPQPGETAVLTHRGDPDQAAAVIAWPAGGGVRGLPEARQLQILTDLFNNRLFDAMRERAGASYAPNVGYEWPNDLAGGGRITAMTQLRPQDVQVFFREADRIADDLAANPPTQDELDRVTEPLRQLISRASTGNQFWMWQLEGATADPMQVALLRSLLSDYTRTTPQAMQELARKYFGGTDGWRLAVIPEGQELASLPAAAAPGGR
ncbi:MAG: M16 family metallopeptidase, partial [Qipengyuania sp.]